MTRCNALVALSLLLAACGPKREDIQHCATTPVEVPRIVETRAPIPVELVEPLDDPTDNKEAETVGEAVTFAEERRRLVAKCQADRTSLRMLDGPPVR